MKLNRVLVVGGGSAGLTAAVNLRNQGCDVVLSELRKGAVGGAALGLSSNALIPLRDIGVLDELLACGTPNLHYYVCDYRGDPIVDIKRPQPDNLGFPVNIVVTRRDLNRVLVAAAERADVRMIYGRQIEQITPGERGVDVRFADGRDEHYDAVVGADGVGSTVRRLVWGEMEVGTVGQYGLRWMSPERPSIPRGAFYVGKTGNVLGAFPVTNEQLYVVLSCPEKGGITAGKTVSRGEILACLDSDFEGDFVRDIARDLPDEPAIHGGYYPSLLVSEPWYRGRVVLIGDAAHAMPPYSSSGAAMAIEDGAVLAKELEGAPDWDQAMRRFMDRRGHRVRTIFDMAMDRVPASADSVEHDTYSPETLGKVRALWDFLLQPV